MVVSTGHRRCRQPRGRRFRHGHRAAALRAFSAAQLFLRRDVPTLGLAAAACGANPSYVRALVALVKAENETVLNEVLTGRVPVLAAARQVPRLAELVAAYRQASARDRVSFARAIGPTALFDDALVPATA
jgi:hypothetical protein